MLIAVKTYVNYSAIIDEIENVNNNINSVEQEIAYAENFYSKYLDSEYSMYFLSHKNNILFD
jgi:ASC-1-like (ASCH) protein